MGDLENLTRLPDDFDGQVRLFPLPGLVLFPHAMQPLHIFEPRYCEMLNEALSSDQLIAMATIVQQPAANKGAPPIDATVCIGKIVSHIPQEDERHNILLVGIKRARVTAEIDAGRCFRIARIDVLDDLYPPANAAGRSQLRAALLSAFGNVIPATSTVKQGLGELMAGSMALGPITDVISHTLPLPVAMKLELLAEPDVDRRAACLIGFLASGAVQLVGSEFSKGDPHAEGSNQRLPFPPPFSLN